MNERRSDSFGTMMKRYEIRVAENETEINRYDIFGTEERF